MQRQTIDWNPETNVSEPAPGVYFVEGPASNWTVVRAGSDFILVDSGYPGDREHVLASLRWLGLEPAAAEVARTLPELQQRAKAGAEARRLERLWTYQETPDGKGKQYHASIYAKGGPTTEGPERVTLFIRNHPEWGQSTYLMRDEGGFVCPRDCALTLRFDDGKPERWAATIPPTGEPAIFIDKNEALVARLLKSQRLSIDTEWKNAGKKTLEFEVGGLQAAKLPPVKKK